jgi:hypothetical protein
MLGNDYENTDHEVSESGLTDEETRETVIARDVGWSHASDLSTQILENFQDA